jgi:hypothetical protein
MRTNIIVPILIIGLAITAIGVAVYETIAPPPMLASNITVTPIEPAAATSSEIPPKEAATPSIDTPPPQAPFVGSSPAVPPTQPYATTSSPSVMPGCRIGGCSGEICDDASAPDKASICLYREDYACYTKVGRCEKQANGHCGWTQTSELKSCIANYQNSNPQNVQ